MEARRTSASAEKMRIMTSDLLISRLNSADALPCWIDAERMKSSASVDLPTPGRAATITIWPPRRPFVRSSKSAKPVGIPISTPSWLSSCSISPTVEATSSAKTS